MTKSKVLLSLFLASMLFLIGCTEVKSVVVKNTKISIVEESIKKYVGRMGYKISYREEGHDYVFYRIYIDTKQYMPSNLFTSYGNNSAYSIPIGSSTSIVESMVLELIQTEDDVMIRGALKGAGGLDNGLKGGPGRHFDRLKKWMKNQGFLIEEPKKPVIKQIIHNTDSKDIQ